MSAEELLTLCDELCQAMREYTGEIIAGAEPRQVIELQDRAYERLMAYSDRSIDLTGWPNPLGTRADEDEAPPVPSSNPKAVVTVSFHLSDPEAAMQALREASGEDVDQDANRGPQMLVGSVAEQLVTDYLDGVSGLEVTQTSFGVG